MSAINEIDQELLDHFDEMIEIGAYNDNVKDLVALAKKLIEFNAQETEEKMRYKTAIIKQIDLNKDFKHLLEKDTYCFIKEALDNNLKLD